MIDAIGFRLRCEDTEEREKLLIRLSQCRQSKGKRGGSFFYRQNGDGFFIHSSLPSLLHGTNVDTLRYDELVVSLARLEEILGINLQNAWLCTVEVGVSIGVEATPSTYMATWGKLRRTQKDIISSGQTVLYRNQSWSFEGYDKAAELLSRMPPVRVSGRILRLEYRRKRGLSKMLGRRVNPWALVEPEVYSLLVKRWSGIYYKIPKQYGSQKLILPPTPKAMVCNLASIGLKYQGSDFIETLVIEALRQRRIGTTTATRMRDAIQTLSTSASSSEGDALTSEINAKVDEIAQRELRLCLNQER